MTVMAGATIAPSLPVMGEVFKGIDNADLLVKLVLTLPSVFIGMTAPLSGWIIDKTGRLRLLIFSLILFALAGTTGLYLDNIYHILIGRAFLGLAVGSIMTTVTTLVGDYFEGVTRDKFMGIQSAFMAFGGTVFIMAGGILADINWRYPFSLYAAALLLAPFIWKYLSEPKIETKDSLGGQQEELPPTKRIIYLIYFLGFLGMTVFYMIPVQIPFILKGFGNGGGTNSGIALATTTFFAAISSINYRRIKSFFKLTHERVYSVSFSMMAIGYILVSYSNSFTMIIFSLAIAGLGSGLIMPNANLWTIEVAHPVRRGRLIGGLTAIIFIGQFASPLLVRPLEKSYGLPKSFFAVAVILLILSTGLAFIVKRPSE